MYIPLDVDLPDHPKTRRLRRRLGCDTGTAVGYLACLWSWAFKYAPDGVLGRFEHEEIEEEAGWGGDAGKLYAALVDSGWIDEGKRPGLHDWHDHSGKLVLKRAHDRERLRRFRERQSGDASVSDEGGNADETRTERVRNQNGARLGEERRGEESKDIPPSPLLPVDNSRANDTEKPEDDSCDSAILCPCLTLKNIKPIVSVIDPEHPGAYFNADLPTGKAFRKLARYICHESQQILPTLERPAREEACQRMLVRVCERMQAANGKETIRSLPAYIDGLLKRPIGDVVGDDLVEDLRRAASNGYGKRGEGVQTIGAALKKRKVPA